MLAAYGGVNATSKVVGIHYTQLYRLLRGDGSLSAENAGRLRAVLPAVPTWVWADLLAPLPGDEAVA